MNLFWSHTVWYLLLGIASLAQLIYTLYHSENRRQTFAFYFSLVALPLYFETVVMIFLNAYVYDPDIIRDPKLNPFNDALAGNLFSQFGVASSAVLLIIRRKPFYWYAIVAFIYSMVEVLFVHLDIYRHHWWKTWMTFIGLLLYFAISKWLHVQFIRGVRPLYFKGYILLGMFPICTIPCIWGILDLSGSMRCSTTLIPHHPRLSQYGLNFIFTSVAFPITIWGYYQRHWAWRIVSVAAIGALIYAGYISHLMVFREGSLVPIGILMIIWMYGSVWFLDMLYRGRPQEQ
ncbi:hypothetical protein [Paenibacillus sp. GCM10023250]|uniref:hypothetical protein n=1 Tax=Paenibacillus sp. GCM10023250 TaxID=3252648 RepID=UPI00361B40C3